MDETPPLASDNRDSGTSTEISGAVARLFIRHTGRSPARTRTTVHGNTVLVAMAEALGRGEQRLLASGEVEAVDTLRRRMRGEATAAVEELLGRPVVAYVADIDPEANAAIVAFVCDSHDESREASRAGTDRNGARAGPLH